MSAMASQITNLAIIYSIQAQIKENIKATGDRWITHTKGQ